MQTQCAHAAPAERFDASLPVEALDSDDVNDDTPAPNRSSSPFFRVIDTARRRRRAFSPGERIFIHLRIPGAFWASVMVRDSQGAVTFAADSRRLSADGELVLAVDIPQSAPEGFYRIDARLDSALQVYETIALSL